MVLTSFSAYGAFPSPQGSPPLCSERPCEDKKKSLFLAVDHIRKVNKQNSLRTIVLSVISLLALCGCTNKKSAINVLTYWSDWWTVDCYKINTDLRSIDTLKLVHEEHVRQ